MIEMGDDEFILYIRKRHPSCTLDNAAIGRRVWRWLQDNDATAVKVNEKGQDSYWADGAARAAGAMALPKTATQFRFSRVLLADLYTQLDAIGSGA